MIVKRLDGICLKQERVSIVYLESLIVHFLDILLNIFTFYKDNHRQNKSCIDDSTLALMDKVYKSGYARLNQFCEWIKEELIVQFPTAFGMK